MRVQRRFAACVAVAFLALILTPATAPAGASGQFWADEKIGVLEQSWNATAVTTDGTPVALAAWPSAAGHFTLSLPGQPGNRLIQVEKLAPVTWTEYATMSDTGVGDNCGDDVYPPRTVYPAGGLSDPRDCYTSRYVWQQMRSGPRGLTLPLVAHEFDPNSDTGQGTPVVLHDITQTPGVRGACGVGVLGVRSTEEKRNGGAPESYRYDRAVETRHYALLDKWGEIEDQAPLVDAQGSIVNERHALWSERASLETTRITAAVYAPAEPDITAPWVTITSPADCAQVPVGGELVAEYFCEDLRLDEDGPDTLASCTGDVADGEAVDTSTPGEHTLTVTGVDDAGNERSHSVRYTVVDVAHQDGPDPEPGETAVRALGPTGTLTAGQEGTLWAALGPKEGYPETSSLLAYEPFTVRGMHLAVPLYEHELTTFPEATQVNCHGDEPTVADDGISEQVIHCFNLAAADTVDVFLPVVATSDVVIGVPDADPPTCFVDLVSDEIVVDSTNSIQQAVDASQSGDTVQVAGICQEDVTISGDTKRSLTVTSVDDERATILGNVRVIATSNVTVHGFNIGVDDGRAVQVSGARNTIAHNHIRTDGGVANGVQVSGGERHIIIHNVFEHIGRSAVYVVEGTNNTINHNTVEHAASTAFVVNTDRNTVNHNQLCDSDGSRTIRLAGDRNVVMHNEATIDDRGQRNNVRHNTACL